MLELLPREAGRPKKGGIEGEEERSLVVASRLGEDERSSWDGRRSGVRWWTGLGGVAIRLGWGVKEREGGSGGDGGREKERKRAGKKSAKK